MPENGIKKERTLPGGVSTTGTRDEDIEVIINDLRREIIGLPYPEEIGDAELLSETESLPPRSIVSTFQKPTAVEVALPATLKDSSHELSGIEVRTIREQQREAHNSGDKGIRRKPRTSLGFLVKIFH